MEDDTPSGAVQRQEVGAFVSTYLGAQFAPIGVDLGARYNGSPIIASEEAAPTDSIVQYTPTSVPGGRAPHFWLGAGRGIGDSLFDRLGAAFTILRLGPKPPSAASLATAARDRGVPIEILDLPDAVARDLYDCDLALVRPDQHIAWRGDTSPADAGAVLDRVIGA